MRDFRRCLWTNCELMMDVWPRVKTCLVITCGVDATLFLFSEFVFHSHFHKSSKFNFLAQFDKREDVTMKDLVFERALKSAVTGQQHTTCYQFTLQLQLTKHRNTTTVNDTRKCYRRYRYFLPKLSAIPILFVVVICTHIFIISPFLVTKTIFSNECHTQQSNLKICKVCYKFQTMEVPCNYSSL